MNPQQQTTLKLVPNWLSWLTFDFEIEQALKPATRFTVTGYIAENLQGMVRWNGDGGDEDGNSTRVWKEANSSEAAEMGARSRP